ncbi:phage tail protein [Aerosakkonemataceae cyanobacterium BLCC-F50]|uniref:Phage tail protein n=1 Tax=Floridaenema flaviceps BLCC-F50 TaxID=3153642 RepID=A0ABV4XL88_9CYAN
MPQNGQATHELNYVTANRFYVEMGGQITASFSECSGLGVKIKKETNFEGGVNDYQRIILGQAEFSDVTLKRGITDSLVFWDWVSKTLSDSQKKRRHINILLFNQAGETMQCWTLKAAIPIGWKAPALQANSNTVAIEELTLAYEGLEIAKSKGGGAQELTPGRQASGFIL